MKAEHTPGPWRLVFPDRVRNVNYYRRTMQDCYVIYGPGEGSDWVADIFVKPMRNADLEYLRPTLSYDEIQEILPDELEGKANARLIAAAPDLLAALTAIRNDCREVQAGREPASPEFWAAVVGRAERAIAKANRT